jgi:hypothetical protein
VSYIAREYVTLDRQGRTWTHLVCQPWVRRKFRVRRRWARLARQWRRRYPHLFSADDVRLTLSQPRYHFGEWIAAIHFAETRWLGAVVEKWSDGFTCHPAKAAKVEKILGRALYKRVCGALDGAGPDLFLYDRRARWYWFAEVKRDRDRMKGNQTRTFERIERLLRTPVQLIRVHAAPLSKRQR